MRILKFTLFLAGIFIISSCGSQKKKINRYYVIEKPDSVKISFDQNNSTPQGYCEIVPVEVHPAFATKEIANRSGSHEIVYYRYHHWATGPGKSLTLLLEDYLNRLPVFKGVSTRFWETTPSYRLKTNVYQVEVIQEDESLYAHLYLEFRLYSNQDSKLLLSHQADRRQKLRDKDLNLFAAAVGELYYEELHQLFEKMMQRLP